APALQAGGHGFESRHLHQSLYRAIFFLSVFKPNLQKSPSPALLFSLPRNQRGESFAGNCHNIPKFELPSLLKLVYFGKKAQGI
ncbi:MAG TPA: hypothetical protein PLK24_10770, partial [Atribacter sp.]|uniref:hypothetical protein n=1 Tax=Atribacter sp. TaxID=2847780 RepID=UPI002CEA02D1